MLKNLKLRTKILLCLALILVVVIGVLFLYVTPQNNSTIDQLVDQDLQNVVQLAQNIVQQNYDGIKSGVLTEQQAKDLSLNKIKLLHYANGSGYFWINDYNGIVLIIKK